MLKLLSCEYTPVASASTSWLGFITMQVAEDWMKLVGLAVAILASAFAAISYLANKRKVDAERKEIELRICKLCLGERTAACPYTERNRPAYCLWRVKRMDELQKQL